MHSHIEFGYPWLLIYGHLIVAAIGLERSGQAGVLRSLVVSPGHRQRGLGRALVGTRYRPDLAVLCTGNGAFTMGPDDAALTCKLLGVGQAIPVHYAHNPLVVGPQCGDLFKAAVGRVSPQTAVTLLRPGQSTSLSIARNPGR